MNNLEAPLFATEYKYVDRETKARYVWKKYQNILEGSNILDVGADECYLLNHLDKEASYWGIGLGGNPDQQVDLEKGSLPFNDSYYDVVLCLDVLEHIDNPHETFDELCRVSRHYVVISLPNPWATFYSVVTQMKYADGQPLKFYGLPPEPPEDRHKWFFSRNEAEHFIRYRASLNNMKIVQIDYEGEDTDNIGIRTRLRRFLDRLFLRSGLDHSILYGGPMWAVLEKVD